MRHLTEVDYCLALSKSETTLLCIFSLIVSKPLRYCIQVSTPRYSQSTLFHLHPSHKLASRFVDFSGSSSLNKKKQICYDNFKFDCLTYQLFGFANANRFAKLNRLEYVAYCKVYENLICNNTCFRSYIISSTWLIIFAETRPSKQTLVTDRYSHILVK